jgi:hypothetical protein
VVPDWVLCEHCSVNKYLGQCCTDPGIVGCIIATETIGQEYFSIGDRVARLVVMNVATIVDVAVEVQWHIGPLPVPVIHNHDG